jgi:hypothetical protein
MWSQLSIKSIKNNGFVSNNCLKNSSPKKVFEKTVNNILIILKKY